MGHSAILQLLSMNASPVKPSQELFVVYRIRGSVYLWRNQYRGYRQRRQMCPWYVKHVRVGQAEGPSYCLILSYCLCCQSYLCTHGTSGAQKRYFLFGLRRKQLLRAHDCCSKESMILFDQWKDVVRLATGNLCKAKSWKQSLRRVAPINIGRKWEIQSILVKTCKCMQNARDSPPSRWQV